jgi:hypothetical protein
MIQIGEEQQGCFPISSIEGVIVVWTGLGRRDPTPGGSLGAGQWFGVESGWEIFADGIR